MSAHVVLVTGSRALADTARAEAWAKRVLTAALDALPADALVVTGDAPGPDAWSRSLAHPRPVLVFALDGQRRAHGGLTGGPWWTGTDAERRAHGRRWPLVRNEAIVRWVAARAVPGVNASVLALHAPWSRTHGTAFTARLARKAGLVVAEHTCPAAHAPVPQ